MFRDDDLNDDDGNVHHRVVVKKVTSALRNAGVHEGFILLGYEEMAYSAAEPGKRVWIEKLADLSMSRSGFSMANVAKWLFLSNTDKFEFRVPESVSAELRCSSSHRCGFFREGSLVFTKNSVLPL